MDLSSEKHSLKSAAWRYRFVFHHVEIFHVAAVLAEVSEVDVPGVHNLATRNRIGREASKNIQRGGGPSILRPWVA